MTGPAFLPSVADTLLAQFKALARARIDSASPQDRGELSPDPAYDRVLAGLALVAAHSAQALQDALLSWRRDALQQAARAPGELLVLRKRLAVETVFLEASGKAVGPGSSGLSDRQADALERLAFDWLLNAEKYVEPRFVELLRARERVTGLCGELLGWLSLSRLASISLRFFREVEARLRTDTAAARLELLQLIEGLKRLRLPANNDMTVVAATEFLSKANPLAHVAAVRKSQVQHALAEMLASILQPTVEAGLPRRVMDRLGIQTTANWFQTVSSLRADLATWARASKHVAATYPLLTQLLCLEDDRSFSTFLDPFIDLLHKQVRDKLGRMLALTCLDQVIRGTLSRWVPTGVPKQDIHKWLPRVCKPILQGVRKAYFQFPEQQAMVVQICVTTAEFAPGFAIGSLVLDLLAVDASSDSSTMGLRALLAILQRSGARSGAPVPGGSVLASPRAFSTTSAVADQAQGRPEASPEGGPAEGNREGETELLRMLRYGESPLEACGAGSHAPAVTRALGRLLNNCHASLSSYTSLSALRPPVEALPKERQGSIAVLAGALSCIPYLQPDAWPASRLADDLPGYTVNAEAVVRQAAVDTLRRIMRGQPAQRSPLLQGVASFACRLPDDCPEAIGDALQLLGALVREWLAILREQNSGSFREPYSAAALRIDVARLEGTALSCLCHVDPDLRRIALALLGLLRDLHKALVTAQIPDSSTEGETGGHIYVADVWEEAGPEIVRRSYWSFGPWSELWRVWKAMPEDGLTLEALMSRCSTGEDHVRWARCMSELVKEVGVMSPPAAASAYIETSRRLAGLVYKDGSGRVVWPSDPTGETAGADLARTYCMVAAACPPLPVAPRDCQTPPDLVRLLLLNLRTGNEAAQQTTVLALGFCNPGHYELVLRDLQVVIEEYSNERLKIARGRVRREDMRFQVGRLLQHLADGLQPGQLRSSSSLRGPLLDWITDTQRYLGGLPPQEGGVDVLQLRYSLCWVTRAVALDLGPSLPSTFTKQLRRSLFDAFGAWCKEGTSSGNVRAEMLRALSHAKARVKDPDQARQLEQDITEAAEYVDVAARQARAALLLGPAFDLESKQVGGRVFTWLGYLFAPRASLGGPIAALGPSREAAARSALFNLLSTNPDVVGTVIDQCYSNQAPLARGFFQVLAEVYSSQELGVRPHILLSLLLYKAVDEVQEVRDDAMDMLEVLAGRVWKEGERGTETVGTVPKPVPEGRPQSRLLPVVGSLPDSYHQFQYQLSAKLARDHPELSELLCVEMMTRLLDVAASGHLLRRHVLIALQPWMENLSFAARWEGNWSEQLLKSMYYLTRQHGDGFPHEVERLWATVAANKRNAIPILDFLICRGMQEVNNQDVDPLAAYFDVGKRIALYLARVSPQQTIDHLVYEVAQLLQEEEAAAPVPRAPARAASAPVDRGDVEFHHPVKRSRRNRSETTFELRAPDRPRLLLPSTPSGMISGNLRRMSELLKVASGAGGIGPVPQGTRSEISLHSQSSFTSSVNDSAMGRPNSNGPSPIHSRRPSDSTILTAGPREVGVLTRPELALCLLTEVAVEHDEDFRSQLAPFLQVLLLSLDAQEATVQKHAQRALLHLLHSLCAGPLLLSASSGGVQGEQSRVAGLIDALRTKQGRRMWPREDPSLLRPHVPSQLPLANLVTAVVEAVTYESDLRERWASEALRWMLEAASRHRATRSHQVYRALKPAASTEAVAALLAALHKCLADGSPLALDMAVDIILTLQVVVEGQAPGRLLLYPQLVLATIAALSTTYVLLYTLLLDLFQKVLERLDFNDANLQSVVIACLPTSSPETRQGQSPRNGLGPPGRGKLAPESPGTWELGTALFPHHSPVAIQQLLIKALFRPETELAAVQVLGKVAEQVAGGPPPRRQEPWVTLYSAPVPPVPASGGSQPQPGAGVLLGDPMVQMTLSIFALLPWWTAHFRHSPHASLAAACIQAHARACRSLSLTDVADALLLLHPQSTADLGDLLSQVCAPLCSAFFPRTAKLAIQRLMEVVGGAEEPLQARALTLLMAVMRRPGLDLGAHSRSAGLGSSFQPLASLLPSPLGPQALQVLDVVMGYYDAKPSAAEEGPAARAALLSWPHCFNSSAASHKEAAEAVGRILDSWNAPGRKLGAARLMPFLDASTDSQAGPGVASM